MGEILKKTQTGDRPEFDSPAEDDADSQLNLTPLRVDFVSTRGVLRAYEARPGYLEIAPHDSEVWGDYSKELGRRAARMVARVNRTLKDSSMGN